MSELLDLVALIRADTPLLVIETPDESRVMDLFRQSLMHVWRALYRWSVTEGLRRIDMDSESATELAPDLSATLRDMQSANQRGIYLLMDATPYLGYASYQRALRDIIQRRGSQYAFRCNCRMPIRCSSWSRMKRASTPCKTAVAG